MAITIENKRSSRLDVVDGAFLLNHERAGILSRSVLRSWRLLGILGLVLLLPATQARADRIVDSKLGFSITIPPGFSPDQRVVAADPSFIYGFRQPVARDQFGTAVAIERMGGVIGRERIKVSMLPPQAHVFTVPWNGFEVDGVELQEVVGGLEIVTYNVQVPLVPNAIQVKVVGARSRAAELKRLAASLVSSIEGRTNRIVSLLPPSIRNAPWYGPVMLALLILIMGAGLVCIWIIGRRSSRAAAFAVAVFLIGTGFAVRGRSREALGLSGGLRLAGFVGIAVAPLSRIGRKKVDPARGADLAAGQSGACEIG